MTNHLWQAKQDGWECVACGQKEEYRWPQGVTGRGKLNIENKQPHVEVKVVENDIAKFVYHYAEQPTFRNCEVMKLAEDLKMYAGFLGHPYNFPSNATAWRSYIDTLEKALGIMMEIDLKTPCGMQAKLAQFNKP